MGYFSSGKKRTLISLTLVVFVILILYAVFHTSLDRHQIKSTNEVQKIITRPIGVAKLGDRSQPLTIRKKIHSFSKIQPQKAEKPQIVIVRKKIFSPIASDSEKITPYSETKDLPGSAVKAGKEKATAPKMKTDLADAKTTDPSLIIPSEEQLRAFKKASLHPYSIMLSSCRLWESVSKLLSDYRERNLSPYFVKVGRGESGIWWRILLGYYKTREEALRIREKNNLSESLVVKMPYANLIDIFSSETQAIAMMEHLEKLQYSPYIIKHDKSTFQLLVGAFITKEAAEKQRIELLSIGIPNKVIER